MTFGCPPLFCKLSTAELIFWLDYPCLLVFSLSLVREKHTIEMVCQIAPSFNHPNVTNAVLLLMTPLTS